MLHQRLALHLETLPGVCDPRHVLHKMRTAAAAGFHAVAIPWADIHAWLEAEKHLKQLHHAAMDMGLSVTEIGDVGIYDAHGHVADRVKEFAAALALGAPIVSVAYNKSPATVDEARRDWQRFVQIISDVEGVSPALHFRGDVPPVDTLDAAWDILGQNEAEARIVLDIYDFWRGGSGAATLESAPVEWIGSVHLTDVRHLPRETATRADRVLPGHGVAPLTHIVSTLNHRGYEGAFCVVGDASGQRGSVAAIAEDACACARRVLGTSGPGHRKPTAPNHLIPLPTGATAKVTKNGR